MNVVKLIGNVGQDIQVREFEGSRMITFTLATNESYVNRNKENIRNTSWHTITAWGKLADSCGELVTKGKLLMVEGRLNYRQYQNKDNQTVKVAEIVAQHVGEVSRKSEVA